MSKGLFDDLIDNKSNKLAEAAKYEKNLEPDIYFWDWLRVTLNLIFSLTTIHQYFQKENVLIPLSLVGLMCIDILPKVFIKFQFYKMLSKNKDYKPLRTLGSLIRYCTYGSMAVLAISLYSLQIYKIQNEWLAYFATMVLYVVGVTDGFINLLTQKFLNKKTEGDE